MVEKPIREKFAKACRKKDHSAVNAMLMMFLSNAFPRSYVAGFKHITRVEQNGEGNKKFRRNYQNSVHEW